MISLRGLECLVTIAEQGSLTRAAAVPHMRTGSPRTAAQLAAAGMGVAIVPVSALTPCPYGTVRSLHPPESRDVIIVVAVPHEDLVWRFVPDLKQRGLPSTHVARFPQPGRRARMITTVPALPLLGTLISAMNYSTVSRLAKFINNIPSWSPSIRFIRKREISNERT